MLNQTSHPERLTGRDSDTPKAVSPLQQEINELKYAIETHNKDVLSLKDRLKPIWTDTPSASEAKGEPIKNLSEMPTQVRDCRLMLVQIESVIQFLMERVEV